MPLSARKEQSERTFEELSKSKLIRTESIIYVTSGFFGTAPQEADIEDLLDPAAFKVRIDHTYAKELGGQTLHLNPNVPRIAKRYEQAFAAVTWAI